MIAKIWTRDYQVLHVDSNLAGEMWGVVIRNPLFLIFWSVPLFLRQTSPFLGQSAPFYLCLTLPAPLLTCASPYLCLSPPVPLPTCDSPYRCLSLPVPLPTCDSPYLCLSLPVPLPTCAFPYLCLSPPVPLLTFSFPQHCPSLPSPLQSLKLVQTFWSLAIIPAEIPRNPNNLSIE